MSPSWPAFPAGIGAGPRRGTAGHGGPCGIQWVLRCLQSDEVYFMRPQITIKQMMICVLLFSLVIALWGEEFQYHRSYWASLVRRHADAERECAEYATAPGPPGLVSVQSTNWRIKARQHRDRKEMYEYLLKHPWAAAPQVPY